MKFSEICCDSAILNASSPLGESGVSILGMQFQHAAHFTAMPQQHLIFFQLSPHLRLDCSIAGRSIRHETTAGMLAICPAGADASVTSDARADLLLVAVRPGHLSLAAAEDCALDAQLHERVRGYDRELLDCARALSAESAGGYHNGPMLWNETAGSFINRLVRGHTSARIKPSRGSLDPHVLRRIRDYVDAHLADTIEVDELAALAGRSSFHFSRVFARSVGMTPHRYVVRLRLQAAIDRIHNGMSLADVAADTGFADQSHLSRWIRRVYGVAPSELA
jgi:AraC family transcriptional regulator